MNCTHLMLIHRQIRVARSSAQVGQCKIARHWLNKAGRNLKAATANFEVQRSPCFSALVKGVGEMLAAGRKDLEERCDRK